jgi:hypothetical protein
MNAICPTETESAPIQIEPCELCGCAIEDMEALIHLRAAELIEQWELADRRPRKVEIPFAAAQPYRTPQSTVDAFWYVASLDDPDYLKRWLAEHPRDVTALQKLWEAKHARP